MKRIFLFISLSLVVACSNNENSEVIQNVDENTNEEVGVTDVSVKFSGIDIVYDRPVIQITGDVQTTEDRFYYTLVNEEEVIIEETLIEVDEPVEGWSAFSFEIDITDEELSDQDVPFLTFYGKDGEEIINPNYVPVDLRFY